MVSFPAVGDLHRSNLPSFITLNVAVIVLLSVDPATETLLIPLGASVYLNLGHILMGLGLDLSPLTLVFCCSP